MDNSPTALFDSYESDFKQIIDSIREKLDEDAKDQQGGTSLCPCYPVMQCRMLRSLRAKF